MKDIREQLSSKFPIMNQKVGRIIQPQEDFLSVLLENNKPRTLILLCGVEGSGKTTFAQKHLGGYTVINLDDILIKYLDTHKFTGSPKQNEELNNIFFTKATQGLEKGVTILDCANHDMLFRGTTLEKLKPYYDKVIVFVFNPDYKTIVGRIQKQIALRMRPNLFQDVATQYSVFQYQITHHILELGVDEVHFLTSST